MSSSASKEIGTMTVSKVVFSSDRWVGFKVGADVNFAEAGASVGDVGLGVGRFLLVGLLVGVLVGLLVGILVSRPVDGFPVGRNDGCGEGAGVTFCSGGGSKVVGRLVGCCAMAWNSFDK